MMRRRVSAYRRTPPGNDSKRNFRESQKGNLIRATAQADATDLLPLPNGKRHWLQRKYCAKAAGYVVRTAYRNT